MTTPSQSSQARRSPSSQSSSNMSEVTIGQFRRLDHIGKGSFAEVFRGIHLEKNKIVAIKSVNLSKLNKKLRDNLATEIKILKSLRHPHVVSLIDCQETPSRMHIIMEFCELGDLSAFIKKRADLINHPSTKRVMEKYPNPPVGGLNEVIVRHFAKQIASALEFIRFKTYIHRDLKPQNLLLTPSSQHYYQSGTVDRMPLAADGSSLVPAAGIESLPMLKIADFGFARFLPRNSLAETLCGSPLYMAPEILRYEKYDEKADLWSVGTVLFEMMCAKPPFRASNHVELARKIEERRDQIKFQEGLVISREMKTLIRGLLKRKPIERYGYTAFLADPVIRDEIPGLVDEDLPQPFKPEPEPVAQAQPPQKAPVEVERVPQESPYSQSPKERSPYGATPPPRSASRTSSAQKLGTSPSSLPSSSRRTSNAPSAAIEQRTAVQERRPAPSHSNTAPVRTLRDREPLAPAAAAPRRYSRDEPSSGRAVREQLTKHPLEEKTPAPEPVSMKQSLNQSALDSALDEGFVFVEKRRVEIDALADELATHPKSLPTAREVVKRRATTQNSPSPSPITSADTPSKAIAIQQTKQGTPHQHQRGNSYEGTRRAYRPSFETATSAISKAMAMVAQRGLGISPPALPKGLSPPLPYAVFPPYPASQSSLLFVEPGTGKISTREKDGSEDMAVIRQIEELAQLSHVVYGFAEVKYKQIVPVEPSDVETEVWGASGLPRVRGAGGTAANASSSPHTTSPPNPNASPNTTSNRDKTGDDDSDADLTPDAIVQIAEEALVLFIKSLAILNKAMDIAGSWWHKRCRLYPNDPITRGAPPTDRLQNVVTWIRDRFNTTCAKSEVVARKLKAAQRLLPRDHKNNPASRSGSYSGGGNGRSGDLAIGAANELQLMTGVTAEKLMYERALEMSRQAAINELMVCDFEGSELGYATAMRMLEAILEDDEEPSSRKGSEMEGGKEKGEEGRMGEGSKEINGVDEEDRESIRQLLEGLKERHRTLKKKMQLQKAEKRNSITSAPIGMRPPSRSSPSSHQTGGTPRS